MVSPLGDRIFLKGIPVLSGRHARIFFKDRNIMALACRGSRKFSGGLIPQGEKVCDRGVSLMA